MMAQIHHVVPNLPPSPGVFRRIASKRLATLCQASYLRWIRDIPTLLGAALDLRFCLVNGLIVTLERRLSPICPSVKRRRDRPARVLLPTIQNRPVWQNFWMVRDRRFLLKLFQLLLKLLPSAEVKNGTRHTSVQTGIIADYDGLEATRRRAIGSDKVQLSYPEPSWRGLALFFWPVFPGGSGLIPAPQEKGRDPAPIENLRLVPACFCEDRRFRSPE